MLVAKRFLSTFKEKFGNQSFPSDGGTWYHGTCKFLKLKHGLDSSYEKSLIKRTMQYIKDRTIGYFDNYFPCRKNKCKLKHIKQWLKLFVYEHNKEIIS